MKTILLTTGSLALLLASCAPLGLYSKGHLTRATSAARIRGIAEGRSIEVRRVERQRQFELSLPQPTHQPYEFNVPAHTTPDGIKILGHKRISEIATQ